MGSITTNVDLANAASRNHIPLIGIYFKDQLPRCVKEGGYIFNLQDHDKGDGTHWTGAWVERDNRGRLQVIYFDPFGIAPTENIKLFFYPIDKTLEYNRKHIQNINSYICGYYVLFFLYWMSRSVRDGSIFLRFRRFLRLWDKPEKNRELLMKYLKPLE